jgi:hypothetical protein
MPKLYSYELIFVSLYSHPRVPKLSTIIPGKDFNTLDMETLHCMKEQLLAMTLYENEALPL